MDELYDNQLAWRRLVYGNNVLGMQADVREGGFPLWRDSAWAKQQLHDEDNLAKLNRLLGIGEESKRGNRLLNNIKLLLL